MPIELKGRLPKEYNLPDLSVGMKLDVELTVINQRNYPWDADGTIIMTHSTDQPLNDTQLREQLVGKEFIFSTLVWILSPARPFGTSMWPLDRMHWVQGTLAEGGGVRQRCKNFVVGNTLPKN